uniref:Uncharacterized protein n=1 Tax=Solanum demissum TaxID=50514 RepID=Q6L3Z3_SOLDE|nr:hypothetical protein SDM1_46t00006 [Solanum demissum]
MVPLLLKKSEKRSGETWLRLQISGDTGGIYGSHRRTVDGLTVRTAGFNPHKELTYLDRDHPRRKSTTNLTNLLFLLSFFFSFFSSSISRTLTLSLSKRDNNDPKIILIQQYELKINGVRNEEGSSFIDGLLGDSEPVFDQTPEVGLHSSTDSSDIDKDNDPLKWALQSRMVPVSTKGKEKVTEETPKRKPFTRATSQKLMGDAMKSSETITAENRKRRRSGNMVIELPTDEVVDVSNKPSENESLDEDTPLAVTQKGKGKQVKNKGKSKPRTSSVKKADTITKGRGNEPQKKKEPSKRKRETSLVLKKKSEHGPSTKGNKDDKEVNKQIIINNLHLQKVLGGRVFDPKIITKPGMESLADLVELQSWTHLFMTKSHDGSLYTWVGNESLHLDEELLGKILEVPREGTRSVVGKFYTKQFVKECSKLPDMHRAVASAADLFVMEALCKFEPFNLSALMLEHMHKIVIEHNGKHGMGYGYILTKVFQHLNIPVGKGTVGAAKQSFSLNTLVECECIEGKAGPLSKMSQLQTEGPGTEEANELRLKNAALLAQNVVLQEKLIKDRDEDTDRLTLVSKSLSHQPPST